MVITMHKLRIVLFSLVILSSHHSYAEEKSGGDTATLPAGISKFIPNGYEMIAITRGDLNLDKFQDVIVVLKTIGEDTAFDASEFKRPLLLLLGNADNNFVLGGRNDHLVYCYQCGGAFGDPFDGIEISKGVFTVNHFGGTNLRWSNAITFKYSPSRLTWYLHKIVDKGWHVSNLEKVEVNVKTRKDFGDIAFEKYNPDE